MKIEQFYNKKEKKQQWRTRFQFNKKEYYLSADTKKELNELVEEIRVSERRFLRGLPDISKVSDSPLCRELFDKILGETEDSHRKSFLTRIFGNFLVINGEDLIVTDLRKTHFQKYIKWRSGQKGFQSKKPVKLGTIFKEVYAVRGAFSRSGEYFSELENYEPPSVTFPKDKQAKIAAAPRKRIVSRDAELDLILAELRQPRAWRQTEDHHFARVRLADSLEFRFETGLRRKEVARLSIQKNYRPAENALRDVVRWKTGTITPFFPLTRRASQIIEERIKLQCGSDFIFSPDGDPIESEYRTLREVSKKLDINYGRFKDGGFVIHDLRHNFGSEIIRNTDIETARELLGHSNIEQTGDYLHTDENRLREAMRRRDGYESKIEMVKIYKAVRRGKMNVKRFIETVKKLS